MFTWNIITEVAEQVFEAVAKSEIYRLKFQNIPSREGHILRNVFVPYKVQPYQVYWGTFFSPQERALG